MQPACHSASDLLDGTCLRFGAQISILYLLHQKSHVGTWMYDINRTSPMRSREHLWQCDGALPYLIDPKLLLEALRFSLSKEEHWQLLAAILLEIAGWRNGLLCLNHSEMAGRLTMCFLLCKHHCT